MWKNLKSGYEEFKRLDPGERFLKTYERRRLQTDGLVATVLIVTAGIILVIAGLLLGLVPGVPGIVLGVLGLALIATRFRRLALWLDWVEVRLRNGLRRFRRASSEH